MAHWEDERDACVPNTWHAGTLQKVPVTAGYYCHRDTAADESELRVIWPVRGDQDQL